MKTIVITSNITYAPQNYTTVLDLVLRNSRQHIDAVILVKINFFSILCKVPYLYFSGCKNIARTLLCNTNTEMFKSKEKLLDKYNIPFIYTENVNDSRIVSWIAQRKPDLLLNLRGRCIYKDVVLKIPRLGCVNVHHGILPQQRGLFCDLYAIADNRETGFTIHEMTNQIDQGKIFFEKKIQGDKNYIRYLEKVSFQEGQEVSSFINNVAKSDELPEGVLEECDQPIITRTPNLETIKRLQRDGMIL